MLGFVFRMPVGQRFIISVCLMAETSFPSFCEAINTCNQTEFDKAMERINNGEEMHIRLAKKSFLLKKLVKSNAPLYISGRGSTITCYTKFYN